jgi:hypothetical protein
MFEDIKEEAPSPLPVATQKKPARKGSHQSRAASTLGENSDTPAPRVRSTRSIINEDSDDSEEVPPPKKTSTRATTKSRTTSRAGSAQPLSQTQGSRKKTPALQPLFLDSDIEEEPTTLKEDENSFEINQTQTMTSTAADIAPPKIVGRKRGAASMDVDSDEDAVFGKRKTRRR